jgi:dipeptidyl aminopeptidase/acylaminoacyl peptidase
MKGVTTATLFVSGDPNKNSNAEKREDNVFMYAALRDQGIPTELVQYDNEGHGLTKLDDQLDLLQRATAWFDEHLMHVSMK